MANESELSRRNFLTGAIAAGAVAVAGRRARAQAKPLVELPPLPWAENALEPYISARTISFHYGKHHRAYVDNTNKLTLGTPLAGRDLVTIIRESHGKPDQVGIFNNAAQVWNHDFYWRSMKPKGGGTPSGALRQRIDTDFGSFGAFTKEFSTAATTLFGSGWVWLVEDGGKLKIVKTANAETPIATGQKPLLTIDAWEHAYYLDYQNRRPDYVKAYLEHLAAWDFAAENLGQK